ncbi:serine hydrolase [Meiothermus sp.]|uniref:serine hydrolase domain-containing protein n=1 Tax=Meiothermus sp. TaxID=1955249 RepID=UPI0021DBD9B1|nr:serine hydrolase domain-containing protein [Meiothermus sp.]GIW33070.1 MAG: esterase [Meiothermus sp.]
MLEKATQIVQEAIESGRIPGAALGVVHLDGSKEMFCAGLKHLQKPGVIDPDTLFDLASLTKVLFTVPQILHLVEEGLADLDDPLSRFLPELAWMQGSELPRRTLRQLLTHVSGLPGWEAIYTWGGESHTLKQRVLQHRWEVGPAGSQVYSDIGYILLGLVLERVRGHSLAAFALPEGFCFNPTDPQDCAATEQDPWRGRVLQGEVHDENCFALGGATGHAGLFGSLRGVLAYAQRLMKGEVLSEAALAEMRRPQHAERALGWQIPQPAFSGGSLCSRQTLGHTGFTGTGVWMDFERGYAWVLLTNRVHPSRHRETGILELRRAVGNAIAAAWKG